MIDEKDDSFQGFAKIRNGLKEHLSQGYMCPSDFGLFMYLIMSCDCTTGIYVGSAMRISSDFGRSVSVDQVRHSLHRLRNRKYINYRVGRGLRGNYPILIDKYEPTFGAFAGKRLDAWKQGTSVEPTYIKIGTRVPVASGWTKGATTDQHGINMSGLREASPYKDIRIKELRIKDLRNKEKEDVLFCDEGDLDTSFLSSKEDISFKLDEEGEE